MNVKTKLSNCLRPLLLGALIGLTKIVKPESITKVLETQIHPNFLAMNRQALELGTQMSEGLGD